MKKYQQITFAQDYDRSFEDFKKEFSKSYVFKNMSKEQREKELAKAYKTATDGNLPKSSEKSKKANASKDK
jgi:hypothetical protein